MAPQNSLEPHCIVQGGQKDFGLHRFADVFASNGFTVLVFDYRCGPQQSQA